MTSRRVCSKVLFTRSPRPCCHHAYLYSCVDGLQWNGLRCVDDIPDRSRAEYRMSCSAVEGICQRSSPLPCSTCVTTKIGQFHMCVTTKMFHVRQRLRWAMFLSNRPEQAVSCS